MQVIHRLSLALFAISLAALTAGCAVESYPGLSTSNDIGSPVLSKDERKEVIRDLTEAQEQHRSDGEAEPPKVQ